MKKQNARIPLPTSQSELIGLAGAIKTEHDEQGKASPLIVLDWEENGPLITEAVQTDAKIKSLEKEIGILTERRSILADGPVVEFVRASRDVLAGKFRGQFRKLADFGFEVEDSPRAAKPAKASDKKVSA